MFTCEQEIIGRNSLWDIHVQLTLNCETFTCSCCWHFLFCELASNKLCSKPYGVNRRWVKVCQSFLGAFYFDQNGWRMGCGAVEFTKRCLLWIYWRVRARQSQPTVTPWPWPSVRERQENNQQQDPTVTNQRRPVLTSQLSDKVQLNVLSLLLQRWLFIQDACSHCESLRTCRFSVYSCR